MHRSENDTPHKGKHTHTQRVIKSSGDKRKKISCRAKCVGEPCVGELVLSFFLPFWYGAAANGRVVVCGAFLFFFLREESETESGRYQE